MPCGVGQIFVGMPAWRHSRRALRSSLTSGSSGMSSFGPPGDRQGERELGPLAAIERAGLLVRIETGLLYALLRERPVPGRVAPGRRTTGGQRRTSGVARRVLGDEAHAAELGEVFGGMPARRDAAGGQVRAGQPSGAQASSCRTGRGAHQGEQPRQPLIERLHQPQARHEPRLRAGTCSLVSSKEAATPAGAIGRRAGGMVCRRIRAQRGGPVWHARGPGCLAALCCRRTSRKIPPEWHLRVMPSPRGRP